MKCLYQSILDCDCLTPTKEYFHSGCHVFELDPFSFKCPSCNKGIITATSRLTMACDKCSFDKEIIKFVNNKKYIEIRNLAKMIMEDMKFQKK